METAHESEPIRRGGGAESPTFEIYSATGAEKIRGHLYLQFRDRETTQKRCCHTLGTEPGAPSSTITLGNPLRNLVVDVVVTMRAMNTFVPGLGAWNLWGPQWNYLVNVLDS